MNQVSEMGRLEDLGHIHAGEVFGGQLWAYVDANGAHKIEIEKNKRTEALLEVIMPETSSLISSEGRVFYRFTTDCLADYAVTDLMNFVGTIIYGPIPNAAESTDPVPQKDNTARSRKGFVYVMKCGSAFKIGMSNGVLRRAEEIAPVMPYPLEVILWIETEDKWVLEQSLHKRFADKRLLGEWFSLSDQDIESLAIEFGKTQ